ncbi:MULTISPECIES: hypothetical protein [Acidithrix]|uniref:hypothetical protein n=1 Tax=Acidithrix TaxID=1609233 RepID=UPI0006987E74|nr:MULTISPECIES: hypothetical protein [Acidithrix]CAG4916739.1 unnamed protein product [Acidithrix sp. C25]
MKVTQVPITDEEALAVVVSAYLQILSSEQGQGSAPASDSYSSMVGWRFSGRWWSLPVPARRSRPW